MLIAAKLFMLHTVKAMLMSLVKMQVNNVAMSLCSLIHVHCNGSIPDSSGLVNIMKFGNELYTPCYQDNIIYYLLCSIIKYLPG